MPYLIAGLVLVGLLSLFNLALTLALARRLRTTTPHAEAESGRRSVDRQRPRRPGERVTAFSGRFAETGLVAFLSPSCEPCQEQVPHVQAYARELGPERALVVVVDDNEDPAKVAEAIAAFDGTAQVVVGRTGDAMSTAFGVDTYPALFLINADGTVAAYDHDIASLPSLASTA